MKTSFFFILCGAIAVAAVLIYPGSAFAQSDAEEQARAAFRLGRAYYDNGDFVKAAEEFEKAYRISKKPELLYNVYLAYRDANMSREAAKALRGYLSEVNDIPNRAQLKSRLEALERSIKEEEQQGPAPQPTTQPQPAAPVTPPPEEAAKPEPAPEAQPPAQPAPGAQPETQQPAPAAKKPEAKSGGSITPFILMGVGGAMIVGSIVTGIMASSDQSKLKKECTDNICPAD